MTDRDSVKALDVRLELVFKDVFWDATVPVRQISRRNTAAWDSLAHMNLVLAVEQEFGITLADDEVLEFNSFEVVLEVVHQKLGPET